MPSIGERLSELRQAKGLSVEDVAHRTHIHPNLIRGIEGNDYSNFPSTAYAKSFLRQYSDHLGVDASEAIATLDNGTSNAVGHSEMEAIVKGEGREITRSYQPTPTTGIRKVRRVKVEKPGGAPVFLGVILVVLVLAIGVFYFMGYQADSPEQLKAEMARKFSKTGIFSRDSSDGKEADANIPIIEKNPLRNAAPPTSPEPAQAGDDDAELPRKDVPQKMALSEEKPDMKAAFRNRPGRINSRSRELPKVDFEEGTPPVDRKLVRLVVPPEAIGADQPAALRPAGTDPSPVHKERPILRAIPVAEPEGDNGAD